MFFLWCRIKALPSKINIIQQSITHIFHHKAKCGGETIILEFVQTTYRLISNRLGISGEEQ